MPIYNAENFIADALESLIGQDFPDLEILVGDNASTDATLAVCERFAAQDPRIRILPSDENRGLAWNHNRLVLEARGEYFKWAAHDDRYKSTFVSACVSVLEQHPEVVLCYSNTIDIDGDGDVIETWPHTARASTDDPAERFRDVVVNERQCFPLYGLMRTAVLRSTSLLGCYPGSDQPLLAEMALRGRFFEIPEPLFEHREHADRSITAYQDPRDRVVLFDPKKAGKVTFPRWRIGRGFVEAALEAPVEPSIKLRALPSLGPWARMWWKSLVLSVPGGARYAVRQRRRRQHVTLER